MTSQNPDLAGDHAANQDSQTQTAAPVKSADNSIARTAAPEADDLELERLEALADSLSDDLLPGESDRGRISIDGRTGQHVDEGDDLSEAFDPEEYSLNNVKAEASNKRRQLTDEVEPAKEEPKQEKQAEPEAEDEDDQPQAQDKPPQVRLRPMNDFELAVDRLRKGGMPLEDAIAYVKQRQPSSQQSGPELPPDVPGDVSQIDAQLTQVSREIESVDADIDAKLAALDEVDEELDFDKGKELRGELKALRAKAKELNARGKTLSESRQKVEAHLAQSQQVAQTQAEAEFRENLRLAEEEFPEMTDPNSPLRQAMATVHQRWEKFRDYDKLNSLRKPFLQVEEALREIALHPEKYKKAPAAAAPQSSKPTTTQPAYAPRPARGNAGNHTAGPSSIGDWLDNVESIAEIEELLLN